MNIVRPRKIKYQKTFRNKKLKFYSQKKLVFGDSGIKTLGFLMLNTKQMNRFIIFLKRYIKKFRKTKRRFWIRHSYSFCFTKKPKGSRMGKGKGKPTIWVFKFNSGSFFLEFKNIRLGKGLYIKHFFDSILNSKLRFISTATYKRISN